MWVDTSVIFKEDMQDICNTGSISWGKLDNTSVFITGATGLIGYYIVAALLYRNIRKNLSTKVVALVRNKERAEKMFSAIPKAVTSKYLHFVEGTIEALPTIEEDIDYIIHGASPTDSSFFYTHPVDTITSILDGTKATLQLAVEKGVKGYLYLSTMEVYGPLSEEIEVFESHDSALDTMNPRNSYPEAKRLSENLCAGFLQQYGVPINVARLTQTFGPGVKKEDNRVFAYFMRAALDGEDILLKTLGKTKRSYVYLADAVTGLLTILTSSDSGQAYNVANESTYCSIFEMAQLVAEKVGAHPVQVKVKLEDTPQFLPDMYMKLSVRKLSKLGWSPKRTLEEMFLRMARSLER